jgi:hypothetical protein
MYSGKNKTAGLKQPSGCMMAAACRHAFQIIQRMVALFRLKSESAAGRRSGSCKKPCLSNRQEFTTVNKPANRVEHFGFPANCFSF